MKTEIYCLSHKPFTPPDDKIYLPLSVFEDSKDNIAPKNEYYSELTGCYWVWKNAEADILGICHYRRFLLNGKGEILKEDEIQKTLLDYDMITPKILTLNFSYEYGFGKNHKPYYLSELRKLLKDRFPDILSVYDGLVSDVHSLFGNMLIAKRKLFSDYHEWLFNILFALEERIVIDEPDSYHRRIFGFISEFLLYLFIEFYGIKIHQTMVGMLGEKTEVRTIKQKMWEQMASGDFLGAKEYFLCQYEKRPDILMEASDIGFELHILMEAISIAEHESFAGKRVFLENITSYSELLGYVRTLNKIVDSNNGTEFSQEAQGYSNEAFYVAKTLLRSRRMP